MPKSIFDIVKAQELTAYWETMTKDRPPYLGEVLFPAQKKLGLDLKWLKGSAGLPVVLKASAFDAGVIPRERLGFDSLQAQMPFFKESTYIDEELRQQLNMVLETGNQVYIDAIMNRIFNDETRLLEGARARLEQMRMMALTTGAIAVTANGQSYTYDYGMPEEHKGNAAKAWSDPTADIMTDISGWQEKIEDDTGVKPTRAICDNVQWANMKKNQNISKAIYVLGGGTVSVNDTRLKSYLMEELGLEVSVYTKSYKNDQGQATRFMPAETFVLFPTGNLGNTWFGTTPEESDLMSSAAANVSITDTGVAVTTTQKTDPVNVETKVSMIALPSFEAADQIFIGDTNPD